MVSLINILPTVALVQCALAYVSNIKEVNNLPQSQYSPAGGIKTPQNLMFSGPYVCDKYASTIQSQNDTTDFPVEFNLYVANNEQAPNDNYTVDLYFKNPYHQSYNSFAFLNASDSDEVLQGYNPQLISQQPNFGVEFNFNFNKGLLCQFLYQFTIAYQLERTNDTSITSDKIFLVGSCQENQAYHADDYNQLISEGFRCVEYNSGFRYDGGKDWCSKFYPSDQCCDTFQNDELASRDQCPASASSSSSVPSTLLTRTSIALYTPTGAPSEASSEAISSEVQSSQQPEQSGQPGQSGPAGPIAQPGQNPAGEAPAAQAA